MEGEMTWLYIVVVSLTVRQGFTAQMIINPSTVILGSEDQGYLNMTCSLSPPEETLPLYSFLTISIKRNSTRDDDTVVIATLITGGSAQLGNAPDVVRRNPGVTGVLQQGDGTALNPHKGELTLNWVYSTIECEDVGDYECDVYFLDTSAQADWYRSSTSLNVQTKPTNIRLAVYRNDISLPNEGTIENNFNGKVGDHVDMRCSGNIGSDGNTLIDWYQRDPLDSSGVFRKYVPVEGDVLQEGVASSVTGCQYSRESRLNYNVTEVDVERGNIIAFKCSVTVQLQGQQPQTVEGDRIIYLKPVSDDIPDNGATQTTISLANIWAPLVLCTTNFLFGATNV